MASTDEKKVKEQKGELTRLTNPNKPIYLDQTKTAQLEIYLDGDKLVHVIKRADGKQSDKEDDYINNLNKLVQVKPKEKGDNIEWSVFLSSGSARKNNIIKVVIPKEVDVSMGEFQTSENSNRVVVRNYQKFGSYNFKNEEYLSKRVLTISEQRILSSGTYKEIANSGVPINFKTKKYVKPLQTDLHSHFNAVLPARELIEFAEENNIGLSLEDFSSIKSSNAQAYAVIEEIYHNSFVEKHKEALQAVLEKCEGNEKLAEKISSWLNKEDDKSNALMNRADSIFAYVGKLKEFDKDLAEDLENAKNEKVEIGQLFPKEFKRTSKFNTFLNAFSFSPDKQNDFDKLDDNNRLRGKFLAFAKGDKQIDSIKLKNALIKIGKYYENQGQTYCELSLFHSSKEQFLSAVTPKMMNEVFEKSHVNVRFLTAISREIKGENPNQKYDNLRERTASAINSLSNAYVVGIDYCGEELENVKEILPSIKQVASEIMVNYPGKTIRIHAGENDYNCDNVYESLNAIQEVRFEAENYLKSKGINREISYPDVRIGHGVYGLDDRSLELLEKMGGTIELNPNSNLSFNHISGMKDIPLEKIVDFMTEKGEDGKLHLKKDCNLKIVIGTDGPGMYDGGAKQNQIALLAQGLSDEKAALLFEKIEQSEKFHKEKVSSNSPEKLKLDSLIKSNYKNAILEFDKQQGNNEFKANKLKENFKLVEKNFEGKKPLTILGLTQRQYEAHKNDLIKKYLPIVKKSIECGSYIQLDASNVGAVCLVNDICNALGNGTLKNSIKLNTSTADLPEEFAENMAIDFKSSKKAKVSTKVLNETLEKKGTVIVIGGGTKAAKQVAKAFANEKGENIIFDPEFGGVAGEYSRYETSVGQEIISIEKDEGILTKVGENLQNDVLKEAAKTLSEEKEVLDLESEKTNNDKTNSDDLEKDNGRTMQKEEQGE